MRTLRLTERQFQAVKYLLDQCADMASEWAGNAEFPNPDKEDYTDRCNEVLSMMVNMDKDKPSEADLLAEQLYLKYLWDWRNGEKSTGNKFTATRLVENYEAPDSTSELEEDIFVAEYGQELYDEIYGDNPDHEPEEHPEYNKLEAVQEAVQLMIAYEFE